MKLFPPALLLLASGLTGACNAPKLPPGKTPPVPAALAAAPGSDLGSRTQPAASPYPPTTQPGRIRPGDLLSVELFNMTGPGRSLLRLQTVEGDGTIVMPFVREAIAVSGLTASGAETAISKAYAHETTALVDPPEVEVHRLRVAGSGGPPAGPIGKYDLVRIAVANLAGPGTVTVRIERVNPYGAIGLPRLGSRMVDGLSERKAAEDLTTAYRQANVSRDAIVSVVRLEAAPPDADRVDLPDAPIYPVPVGLRWLYEPNPPSPSYP